MIFSDGDADSGVDETTQGVKDENEYLENVDKMILMNAEKMQ